MKNTQPLDALITSIIKALIPWFTAFCLFSQATLSFSAVPAKKDHFIIGAAGVVNTQPYEGLNGFVDPMPLFDIQYGPLFLYNNNDEPIVGLNLLSGESVTLSIGTTYGRTFLDVGKVKDNRKFLYYGIKNRGRSIDFGLLANYYAPIGLVEATLFRDISNKSGGFHGLMSISKVVPDTGNFVITPRFFAKYYSLQFNNYYYRVTDAENNAGALLAEQLNRTTRADFIKRRPSYNSRTSGHLGVDVNVVLNLNSNMKLNGYLSYENFTGPVETSPLVEDKALIVGSFGFSYEF